MTRVAAKEAVPLYAEHERCARAARSNKVGYHRPKSRLKRYMSRRAPVRDSARVYRSAAMKATSYGNFGSVAKGMQYMEPKVLRVGKTAVELRKEADELWRVVDLLHLASAPPDDMPTLGSPHVETSRLATDAGIVSARVSGK